MTKKYRPYFTLPELTEIITCLKSNPTPKRMTLVRYLEKFCWEITHSVREEAYTSNPRQTLAQKLGLEDTAIEEPTIPQITGEAAYQKQLINPLHCTPNEIALAMEYRYTNNLMSPTEEFEYENSLISTKKSS